MMTASPASMGDLVLISIFYWKKKIVSYQIKLNKEQWVFLTAQ